jgi:hypothetical protein
MLPDYLSASVRCCEKFKAPRQTDVQKCRQYCKIDELNFSEYIKCVEAPLNLAASCQDNNKKAFTANNATSATPPSNYTAVSSPSSTPTADKKSGTSRSKEVSIAGIFSIFIILSTLAL